ncbi:sensor histidine kinase [Leptospira idonii]|uniref:Histidine kinase n=1 Tax=Leptospira idonii TaxID=1193500 RepID=A0A4R9LWG4_9LEPT|nr:histidine kinase [Leptospira idonii]TGN17297.1 histidine kinase [Leptospira idonii]
MIDKLYQWLDAQIGKPFLSIALFAFTLTTVFYLVFNPTNERNMSKSERQKSETSRKFSFISPESSYLLGDLPKNSEGKYEFDTFENLPWIVDTNIWMNTEELTNLAISRFVWMRVKAVNIEDIENPYTLLEHAGAYFQVYTDKGDLLFQFGDEFENDAVVIPSLLDTQFNWVSLDQKPDQYYYLRILHREGFLFGINSIENRIASQSTIYNKFANNNLIPLFLYSFFLMIGIICALVYFIGYKKRYFVLLDFSIFAFLFGLLGFSTNDYFRFLSTDRYSLFFISMIASNFVYIPMHSGLRRLFGPGKWYILDVLIYLNLIIGTASTVLCLNLDVSPEVHSFFIQIRYFLVLFSILNILGPIVVTFLSWRKGKAMALPHFIGFSATLILVVIEIYLAIRDQSGFTRVAYWGVLFGVFGQGLALEKMMFSNAQKLQESQANLFKTEKSLKEVQLKTLQTKMSPHYLFNSLNTIHALHKIKPELIGDAILRLANNYRFFSDKTDRDLIPFEEEWEFIDDYLHLQKLRFYDTVTIEFKKTGDFKNTFIPPLVIQPIIENSFKHGFRNSSQGNWFIFINAKQDKDGNLQLTVFDTGAGISEEVLNDEEKLWSRSLGNIKERLDHSFPGNKFEISRNYPAGTRVYLEIPKST